MEEHKSTKEEAAKRVAIAGGGPAGLTLAYELVCRGDGSVWPVVFEATDMLGGISRTVEHKGNRMDIGGHRFFTKSARVKGLWEEILPVQSSPARDELLTGASPGQGQEEGDPERSEAVMLKRRRVSRIFYKGRFFDYPVSLSMRTLRAMGPVDTLRAGMGYLRARLRPLPETSLENFYINRFGRPLYRMFFEAYTEKVWGKHPSELGADWGAQRVKGLSVRAVINDMLRRSFGGRRDAERVETSLIDEFYYPRLGPGQLWQRMADMAVEKGADIRLSTPVESVHVDGRGRVCGVSVRTAMGELRREACDVLVSSLPLKQLVEMLEGIDVPADVRRVAEGLPYRDFMTVGLLVPELKIRNRTALTTYGGRVPDTWIYVQESRVKLGRIQIFNNWSPYMVADYEGTTWIGLEYFCTEGDADWEMADEDFIRMATAELESIGVIDAGDVLDGVRIRMPKAYPSYFGTYAELDKVRAFLDTIPNLYCIGRNGQHRYNNMDHSMLTAMLAADSILGQSAKAGREEIWEVNTEEEYHEK